MQFEGDLAERRFVAHFHRTRTTQDRVFALTQVAIVVLLALRMGGLTAPSMRLLFWGTHAISAAILALSLAAPARYTSLRPHLLIPARAFFSLLCPQLVWQLARQQASAASHTQQSWPGFFLLWVTWTRWGSELLTQVGFLLPFNVEAVLAPFSALLDMLNNRRLCRLLTVGGAPESRPFYRAAFERLATRLAVPFEVLFAAGPTDQCSEANASGCSWNVCTAAAAGWGGGTWLQESAGSSSAAAVDDVSTCYCECVFSLTQVVFSIVLPLALLGFAEARQRRQFSATQLAATAAEQDAGRGERSTAPGRRRRRGGAEWDLSFDRMRLLGLMALIQFRVFLSLRFGAWQHAPWIGAAGSSSAHVEL